MLAAPFQDVKFRYIKVRKSDKKAVEDDWQNVAAYRFNDSKLLEWVARGGNVGIRGGDGNALILDIDAVDMVLDKELVFPDSTTWETRPGRQQRLYICTDWKPEILEKYAGKDKDQIKFFDNEKKDDKGHYVHLGEMQGARHYGVIPPSVKIIDGEAVSYKMLNEMLPTAISLEWLLETLVEHGCRFSDRDKTRLERNAEKLEAVGVESKKRKVLYDGIEEGKKKYAKAAFEDELKNVRSASEGNRNDQLNISALKIGTLVGSGYISRFEAERELSRAARDAGLDEEEIERTIESGMNAGIQEPRAIPEPEERFPLPKGEMQISPLLIESDAPKKEAIANLLVKLAKKNSFEIWHTPNSVGYITVLINSHKEHYKLSSKYMRMWLGKLGHELMGKTVGISAIKDAINVLESIAVYDGKEYQFHVRKAEHEGKIYIDVGDSAWNIIEVSKEGWKVIKDCPIRFRRAGNSLPLPIPERGGKIEDLRPLINASSDANWILIKAWLSQAFWCRGPYAHMYFRGTQGTAKSYMMACLKAISDPSAAIKRRVPKSERDVAIALGSEAIPCFDNMSGVSDHIADLFCVASTGGVSTQRALFTDDEEAIIPIHCPIIYNGIDDLGQRGDLLDRTIVIDLEPIPESDRKPEKEIEKEIGEKKSSILGALLDLTVAGINGEGVVCLSDLPRMADFAEWAYSCLGEDSEKFLEIYAGSRNDTKYDLVEGNKFPKAIYQLSVDTAPDTWKGSASELLTLLNTREHIISGYEPGNWPSVPEKVGSELRRFTPALIALNVEVSYSRSGKEGRKISIRLLPGADTLTPTDTPKTANKRQVTASDSTFVKGESKEKIRELTEKEEKNIVMKGKLADTADTTPADNENEAKRPDTADTSPDTKRIQLAARQEYGINGWVDCRKIMAKLQLSEEVVRSWLDANYVRTDHEFGYRQGKRNL
jgi:hypothetical protein